jgi:hypothetical protein
MKELGIADGANHVGTHRALVAWMGPESGWDAPCDGTPFHGAKFNPLNTTLFLSGCTELPTYNVEPGVQNYSSAKCGAKAVAQTLLHSPDHDYEPLVEIMRAPGSVVHDIFYKIAESDWGTFRNLDGTPNYTYCDAIANTYKRNRPKYNAVKVGPIVVPTRFQRLRNRIGL